MNTRSFDRRLRALALAFAATALSLAFATSASAVSISTFDVNFSSTQALAHPTVNVDMRFSNLGSDDVRDLQVQLPAGLIANPEAVSQKCPLSSFANASCPGASMIGTASTTASAPWWLLGGSWTISGKLHMLEAEAGQLPTVGAIMTPPLFLPKQTLRMNLDIRDDQTWGDYGADGTVVNVPRDFAGIPVTVTRVQMQLNARTGANADGAYFGTNPSSCGTKETSVGVETYGGAVAFASDSYEVTGCENVPFTPEPSVSFTSTTPNTLTDMTATIGIPSGHGYLKRATIVAPKSIRPNFSGLIHMCQRTAFEAEPPTCAAATEQGSFTATTPLLPYATEGKLYLIDSGSAIPYLGAYLKDPNYGLAIRAYAGPSIVDNNIIINMPIRSYGDLTDLPELPLSTVSLTMGTTPQHPSAIQVKYAPDCYENDTAEMTLESWTGAVSNQSVPVAFDPTCEN